MAPSLTDTPSIEFTSVPSYGSSGFLTGRAWYVEPEGYNIAVYINVFGGWWTKPYFASPITSILPDGSWACNVTTGGSDAQATRLRAYLIPSGFVPPLASGGTTLPAALDEVSVAMKEVYRGPTPLLLDVTSPHSGDVVSGPITVGVAASASTGISEVDFQIDGSVVAIDFVYPYSFLWETRNASNGVHTLTIRGSIAGSNERMPSTSIDVIVDNPIIRRITFDAANHTAPAIYADKIVWADDRNGNSDIYLYDIATGTEVQITSDPASQVAPSIWGDVVVWTDYRDGGFGAAYMYTISTGQVRRVTGDHLFQEGPRVGGEYAIWAGSNGFNARVYLYDLQAHTGEWLTDAVGGHAGFAIDDTLAGWITYRDVYVYDLAAHQLTRVTDDGVPGRTHTAVTGHGIAWEDRRASLPAIYYHDLETQTTRRLVDSASWQEAPAASRDLIAWTDYRTGDAEVFLYDLVANREMRLTFEPSTQRAASVSGCRIVWEDDRNGHADIYLAEFETETTETLDGRPSLLPNIVCTSRRLDSR